MCTFVVKEVVSYYINNDSAVYSCAIDMSKVFDRVDLVMLFKRLFLCALPVHIIRILFALYYNLCIKVSWKGCFSESFYTLNGVKQGGILFPTLFNICVKNLLQRLESLGIGCLVGPRYYGSIAYAVDIILLALTLHALRIMLQFCSEYASDNNILFKLYKSQCLKFF